MPFSFSPHIALQVAPYAAAVRFFTQVLGLELLEQGESESQLRAGNMHFYLEDRQNNPASTAGVFFEFTTPDLEAAYKELVQAGCRLEPSQTPEGAKSYFVITPYGFTFHLWEQAQV